MTYKCPYLFHVCSLFCYDHQWNQPFDYEFNLVKEETDGQIDKVGIKATTVQDPIYVKVAKLISLDSISVLPRRGYSVNLSQICVPYNFNSVLHIPELN